MLAFPRLRGLSLAALLLSTLASFTALAPSAQAQVVIKLGTMAATGSPWEAGLKDLANRWKTISGGMVTLKLYAGGSMGNETDSIKKMRIGSLQAVAVSTIGLRDLLPEPSTLSMPFLFASNAERDYVLDKASPELETAINTKGYVALGWASLGDVRLFSTVARPTFADARTGKLFFWEGDLSFKDAASALGLPTSLGPVTDLIPQMSTGQANEVFFPLLPASAINLHNSAKHVASLSMGSLDGVIIVDKKAWDTVPANLRPKLLQAARDVSKAMTINTRRLEVDALARMKATGLTVDTTSPAEWMKAIQDLESTFRGKVFPAATYDRLRALTAEYRQKNP